MGKRNRLTTQSGPESPIQRVPFRQSPQNTGRRAGSLSKPSSVKFRIKIKLRTSNVKPCTCSQGALFIGLQLTTTLLYRHTPLRVEYTPYHSTLYPSNECELGTCRMRVLCLNDRVVQGGGQEAPMYLPLHCRRKSKRRWNLESAAVSYVSHAAR